MFKFWVRIIAVLEIVGGVFGIGIVIWWLLAMPVNTPTLILAPVPIGIYLLSLVSGISLWRGRSFGRKASIVVQLIQLPKIISPQLIFIFSFGFDFWVHYLMYGNFTTLGFEFKFLAFQQFFFNVEDAPIGLGLSIPAFIFLIILFNFKPGFVQEEIQPPPSPEAMGVDDNSESAPNNSFNASGN